VQHPRFYARLTAASVSYQNHVQRFFAALTENKSAEAAHAPPPQAGSRHPTIPRRSQSLVKTFHLYEVDLQLLYQLRLDFLIL
jgi:hypothetical protein